MNVNVQRKPHNQAAVGQVRPDPRGVAEDEAGCPALIGVGVGPSVVPSAVPVPPLLCPLVTRVLVGTSMTHHRRQQGRSRVAQEMPDRPAPLR